MVPTGLLLKDTRVTDVEFYPKIKQIRWIEFELLPNSFAGLKPSHAIGVLGSFGELQAKIVPFDRWKAEMLKDPFNQHAALGTFGDLERLLAVVEHQDDAFDAAPRTGIGSTHAAG